MSTFLGTLQLTLPQLGDASNCHPNKVGERNIRRARGNPNAYDKPPYVIRKFQTSSRLELLKVNLILFMSCSISICINL